MRVTGACHTYIGHSLKLFYVLAKSIRCHTERQSWVESPVLTWVTSRFESQPTSWEVLILESFKLVSNATFFICKSFTHNQVIIWSYTRTGVNNVTERGSLSNPRSHFCGDSIYTS
jgi:hypothetical protein